MIDHLKDVFSDLPTLIPSTTITLTMFDYIHKSLKLCPATRFYWKLLDIANITHMVLEIVKPNFEDLSFLMPNSGGASSISKTMIFVNTIDKAQRIAAYLCTRLLSWLQGRKKEIIRTFLSNLESST